MRLDLSPTGWGRIVLSTILGTLFCIGVALFVDSFNYETYSAEAMARATFTSFLVPTILAGPFIFFVTLQMRRLAHAREELERIAATDSLTNVLNRGAFTMLVDAYLDEARKKTVPSEGALLIVDADHFKSVNDTFGHKSGDQALITMAEQMKDVLREPDALGRLGGEEFGVFLPGASRVNAEAIGERIRHKIKSANFNPRGENFQLTVSVGGVTFKNAKTYDELFVAADKYLYDAKDSGRDCVLIGGLADMSASQMPVSASA